MFMITKPKYRLLSTFAIDIKRLRELVVLVAILVLLSLLVEKNLMVGFGLLWFVVFLSILPLEWIFQTISRLRSRRNFIYTVYVLVCLLDSHFEGRVRMVYDFYRSPPDIVELLKR